MSARHCSVVASSWRLLSLANAGSDNDESADTVTHTVVNANSAARAANKEQRCSVASAVSPNVVPRSASFWRRRSSARVVSANTAGQSADSRQLRSTANTNSANAAAHAAESQRRCNSASSANAFSCAAILWGRRDVSFWPCPLSPTWPPHGDVAPGSTPFLPTSQRAVPSHGDVVPWPAPSLPMLQREQPPPGDVAHRPHWPTLSPAWLPPVGAVLQSPPRHVSAAR